MSDLTLRALTRFGKFLRPEGDCWTWTGSPTTGRYGQFWLDGAMRYAHRASWMLHRGEIPDGLTIDHLCRNTRCVNPDHLDPVPFEVNQRRRADLITQCPKAHPYDAENTRIDRNGFRNCKTCSREKTIARYHRRKRELSNS